ncbi:5-formyltetrahydrofolate cyclo-ligase [Candidatus Palibaumannia cicadellinicola]|uniref:5-formyltetrahydrofolate cyclo-ligase n=1 Tax=Candidatus Palibaumannia cicadellinicola TaxID=186490 RepID=A0A088MZB7_9GAMM|nr:5-formyltetrahydrofolate cyclo-ligase [Candidatus Baumannia cicadellinicola]AIN47569.1 5-formyltetrahydrofolate cyclo-ligase [Candidatus Baumannia cicadellinicola]
MDKHLLRQIIRKNIRLQRRTLTTEQQNKAAHMVVIRALQETRIREADKLALFLSFDGEINTNPLIDILWKKGKQVYLPVPHPFTTGHLLFFQYTPTTSLVINNFNIYEPQLDITTLLSLDQLDILFVPLVAFDIYGHRLGMGGGFYDRTLQNWRQDQYFFPIGLAHDCQYQNEALPIKKWDISLPEIITPSCYWRWSK